MKNGICEGAVGENSLLVKKYKIFILLIIMKELDWFYTFLALELWYSCHKMWKFDCLIFFSLFGFLWLFPLFGDYLKTLFFSTLLNTTHSIFKISVWNFEIVLIKCKTKNCIKEFLISRILFEIWIVKVENLKKMVDFEIMQKECFIFLKQWKDIKNSSIQFFFHIK